MSNLRIPHRTTARTAAYAGFPQGVRRALRALLALVLAVGLTVTAPIAPRGASSAFGDEAGGPAATGPEGASTDDSGAESDGDSTGPEAPDADGAAAPDPSGADGRGAAGTPAAPDRATVGAAATDDPSVGGPAEWVLDKVYGIAFDLAETIAFDALNQAVNPENDEDLQKIIDFVDGLLGGGSSISHECEKILAAVRDLSNQMTELKNDIDAQLAGLEQTLTLQQVENQREQIVKMSTSVYAAPLGAYNEFLTASENYSKSIGTTNEQDRKTELDDAERALVHAFDALNYADDLTTIETFGVNMGNPSYQRYLYNLDKYGRESLAFDHQRFALLTAGINEVITNLNVIVYVQRLEYDYWKAKANGSPDDADLQIKVRDLEKSLHTNLNRVVKDCNWTVSEFANKDGDASWARTDLLTLMRPYDFQTTYTFDFESKSNRTFNYLNNTYYKTTAKHYTAEAVKTKREMPVYRACIDGTPYLIVDGSLGISYGAKHGDLIHGIRYWEKLNTIHILNDDYYGFPDQDFYNLLSTQDGIYYLPTDFTPLAPFVTNASFKGAKDTLTGYLKSNGMTSLTSEGYVLMNSYKDPADLTGFRRQNHYSSFYLYKTNISSTGDYAAAKTTLTTEDSAGDPGMLVMLAQNAGKHEAHKLSVLTEGSGLGITVTDLAGKETSDTIPAGTPLKLVVRAQDGLALDSLVLKDETGEVLETLASAEAATLVEGETNTYTFAMTMPYQDVTLVGAPGQAEPNPLNFVQDESGAFLISTLDDLENVATAFDQHPVMYQDATFRLTADIVNLHLPFPEWTTPIGTEEHPFTGTFDGAGHAIGGFTMDMAADPLSSLSYGGIFGVIGERGAVYNTDVCAIDYTGDGSRQSIGGLAGLNRGLIDNCSTGSAQTDYKISDPFVPADEINLINVTIRSYDAGGLVAVNDGQIINSWSGADIEAIGDNGHAGGLVGLSESGSSIWNCYAMGDVSGGWYTGGFIGANYADVNNAYYSGFEVKGQHSAGSFIGGNHHDVFACYVVTGSAEKPFGTGYAGSSPEASLEVMFRSSMTSDAFTRKLNSKVTGSMDWWATSYNANGDVPHLIREPMIQRTIIDEDTGISITGTIHTAAVLIAEPLAESDASHEALYQHAKEQGLLGSVAASYNALLPVSCEKSGQSAIQGAVKLRIPLQGDFTGRAITVLQAHADGTTALPATIDGNAITLSIDAVAPFAVIVSDEPAVDPADPAMPVVPAEANKSNSGTLAMTGDGLGTATPLAFFLGVTALGLTISGLAAVRYSKRKDRAGKRWAGRPPSGICVTALNESEQL